MVKLLVWSDSSGHSRRCLMVIPEESGPASIGRDETIGDRLLAAVCALVQSPDRMRATLIPGGSRAFFLIGSRRCPAASHSVPFPGFTCMIPGPERHSTHRQFSNF